MINIENKDENQSVVQDKEIDCRRCGEKFSSKNNFMDHYTNKHTRHIICRDWVKDQCRRIKCWYRHSQLKPVQSGSIVNVLPTAQDFTAALPPPQPPASSQSQTEIHKIITQMAMRMNTLELGISESRSQMHTLQQMLSKNQI